MVSSTVAMANTLAINMEQTTVFFRPNLVVKHIQRTETELVGAQYQPHFLSYGQLSRIRVSKGFWKSGSQPPRQMRQRA